MIERTSSGPVIRKDFHQSQFVTDKVSYDPMQTLSDFSDHLNSINKARWFPHVFYDVMSGGLVWSDETNADTPTEVIWALRFITAFRTGVMLNNPESKYQVYWDHGLTMFPDWIGFRASRRVPTKKLLNLYRRGKRGSQKYLRDLERQVKINTVADEGP